MKKIGIITSGGDCGGLNAVVKGAAQMCHHFGIQSYIIPNGYAGLYNLVNCKSLVELTKSRVGFVNSNLAGSEAGHSRVKIRKIDDEQKYKRIKKGLKKFKIDGLVISGGDDSGSVMVDLSDQGIPCIHAPKTMDLDLQTYSVGFDSTVNRMASFAEDLKTTGKTHNRIMIMEVFGRYAGHTAFRSGVAAEADAVLIPEVPVDFDHLYQDCKQKFMERIRQSDVNAGTYLIIVAEGLKNLNGEDLFDMTQPADAFGHRRLAGAGRYVEQQLQMRLKADQEIKDFMAEQLMFVEGIYESPEVRTVTPGHLVRCGHSSVYDVNFGKEAGASAVVLLKNGVTAMTVAGFQGGKIHYIPAKEAIKQRLVDPNLLGFYECMGMCFGRPPQTDNIEYMEEQRSISRFM